MMEKEALLCSPADAKGAGSVIKTRPRAKYREGIVEGESYFAVSLTEGREKRNDWLELKKRWKKIECSRRTFANRIKKTIATKKQLTAKNEAKQPKRKKEAVKLKSNSTRKNHECQQQSARQLRGT